MEMLKEKSEDRKVGTSSISYNSIMAENDPASRKTKIVCTLG